MLGACICFFLGKHNAWDGLSSADIMSYDAWVAASVDEVFGISKLRSGFNYIWIYYTTSLTKVGL